MSENEMVERVAKAIATAGWRAPLDPVSEEWARGIDAYDITNNSGRFMFDLMARAAIEAMREPTLAMRKVSSFRAAEVDWPAMIDAALSDPHTTGPTPEASDRAFHKHNALVDRDMENFQAIMPGEML